MLERLALSRFEVGFSLTHNGKNVWSLPPARTEAERRARVAALCGEEFAAHVIELRHESEHLRLSGWIALPTFSRSQSDLQFAFLNGRFVRDKLIAGAARLAYQDVLFGGRFCAYVLYLGIDPTLVDVNAHPQKLEVRFREARSVHDFMFRTLERALAETRPSTASPGSASLDGLRLGERAQGYTHQGHFALPERPAAGAVEGYWRLLADAAPGGERGHAEAHRRARCATKCAMRCVRTRAKRRRPWDSPSPSCTASTSCRKRRADSCSWTCMRRMSGCCTSA